MPATDLWDLTRPLAPVRYAFRLRDWKGPPWHVRRFKLTEALNAHYRLLLELVTDAPAVDIDELLGDACEFDLDRGTSGRTVHGLVLAADDLGRSAGFRHIRLEIGPALALLDQRVDTRAWQERTAVEILRDVLASPLADHGRSVRTAALRADIYPRRDYCVQYQESDLAFAARLMEEEGVNYFFDHGGAAETLVLVDDNADFPPLQEGPVLLLDNANDTAGQESISSFTAARRLVSTAVAQRNFDWLEPQAPRAAARPGKDLRGRTREVYEHDDIIYPGDGERHARLKYERLSLRGNTVGGRSNVTGFFAGGAFALHGHARTDLDTGYILIRVDHEGDCPDESPHAVAAAAPRYANTFEAVPRDAPLRPARVHPRPRVAGLLTATVTGPPGEEVYCDEHGRIKVLPHWDRLSPADDTSSWWVRVAQAAAGGGWGCVFLPRVGMEVVVDFLDGDPDRPLVVGCVYNGQNAPPYPLPAEKTKTTIKTNTSPGGDGSNELRFEDQAGAEEVYLHAQRDWNTVVEANMSLRVGGGESDSIGGSRSTSVGANDSLTVGANLTESVGANHSLAVGANESNTIGVNQTNTIGINQINTVGTAQVDMIGAVRATSVGLMDALKVGAMRVTTIKGLDVLSVSGVGRLEFINSASIKSVNGFQSTTVFGLSYQKVGMSVEMVDSLKVVTTGADHFLSVGGSRLGIVSGLDIELSAVKIISARGGIGLLVGGTSVVVTNGKVTITGGGPVEIKGSPVTIDGGSEVKINGGQIKLNC